MSKIQSNRDTLREMGDARSLEGLLSQKVKDWRRDNLFRHFLPIAHHPSPITSFTSHVTRHVARAAALTAAAFLCACVAPPKVPNYDAAWPESAEASNSTNGAIYQFGHDVALFENPVAHRVGDSVTIQLVESTNASKSSTTTTKKETGVSIGAPTGIGSKLTANGVPLGLGLDNKNSFTGQGDTSQSNKLEGQITVTVAKRLPNGNLLVRGQKWLTLNQGSEFVRVQGIVRPIDIDSTNTVPSYKVADATISYGGQGSLADANAPGLLSRFFNSKWLPF